jgi:hypothetical protein
MLYWPPMVGTTGRLLTAWIRDNTVRTDAGGALNVNVGRLIY